jgi:DNA-binding MarR family transcriptional regulator
VPLLVVDEAPVVFGTPHAHQRAMHELPFAFKRAHHATLRLLRPLAARHHLTPARFDLLYVLHVKGHTIEPYQFRIAEVLGLCRSTICKMITAMEKAGLVERRREVLFDHRRRRVRLTRYGRHCIRRALKAIRRREIEKPLLQSVTFYLCATRNRRFAFIVDLVAHLRRVLRGLRDPAKLLLYPACVRTGSQKIVAPRAPLRTRSLVQQSARWFLLNRFFAAERVIR